MRRRADAERNRALLLAAAREAYAAAGAEGAVSLEAVARSAGVGIGTLYRNFATREELVEALYRAELDEMAAAADELSAEKSGFDGLRTWLDRYARFVAAKQGMLGVLRASGSVGPARRNETRERVSAAVGRFLEVGAADGTLRDDVDVGRATDLLVGLFVAADPRETDRIAGLLDLVMDALRPRP